MVTLATTHVNPSHWSPVGTNQHASCMEHRQIVLLYMPNGKIKCLLDTMLHAVVGFLTT